MFLLQSMQPGEKNIGYLERYSSIPYTIAIQTNMRKGSKYIHITNQKLTTPPCRSKLVG